MRTTVFVLVALLAGLGAANAASENTREVAASHNALAGDLYRRLAAQDGNLFFSPTSIASALSMALAGARGSTAQEMAEVLHYPAPTPGLHAAAGELQRSLAEPVVLEPGKEPAFRLNVANRIWSQAGFKFRPQFIATCQNAYGAGVGLVDFAAGEKARKQINGWVSEQTAGKIPELLPAGALTERTRLVLTNAIHFLAQWADPFPDHGTADLPFQLATGREATVPTMHQTEDFHYDERPGLQILQLRYSGDRQVCEIYLPRDGDGLAALEDSLAASGLADRSGSWPSRRVEVFLPRFAMTSRFALGPVLSALGMPAAFTDQADFSGMSEQTALKIDSVIHEATIIVDEKGTEAAAATSIQMALTSVMEPVQKPVVFRADHPFFFLIRDLPTGAVLFLGRVADPRV